MLVYWLGRLNRSSNKLVSEWFKPLMRILIFAIIMSVILPWLLHLIFYLPRFMNKVFYHPHRMRVKGTLILLVLRHRHHLNSFCHIHSLLPKFLLLLHIFLNLFINNIHFVQSLFPSTNLIIFVKFLLIFKKFVLFKLAERRVLFPYLWRLRAKLAETPRRLGETWCLRPNYHIWAIF